jgi:hypothetical protein
VEQQRGATYLILRFRSDELMGVTPRIAAVEQSKPGQGVLVEPAS